MPTNTRPSSGAEGNPNSDYEDVVERFRSSYGDSPRDVKATDKASEQPKKLSRKVRSGAYRTPHNINYDGGDKGSTDSSRSVPGNSVEPHSGDE